MRLFRPLTAGFETTGSVAGDRRFDFQCALMSLPLRLDMPIPSAEPSYLSAESDLSARWRERIGTQGFKVGICWQGNPKGRIDEGRSIPLAKYAPLAAIGGIRLISLQRTHGLEQLDSLPSGMAVETLGDFDTGADAFVDTAAIMNCLDLVITSDTAIPHLAGALGARTWVVLKHVPDWRWMLERSDSPWYPSLKLFRQSKSGDWDGAVAAMAVELQAFTGREG
jgi:hypothetical protein